MCVHGLCLLNKGQPDRIRLPRKSRRDKNPAHQDPVLGLPRISASFRTHTIDDCVGDGLSFSARRARSEWGIVSGKGGPGNTKEASVGVVLVLVLVRIDLLFIQLLLGS